VKANYAFRKGELTEKNVTQIVADLSKILPNLGEPSPSSLMS
jgi:hypothetical protein